MGTEVGFRLYWSGPVAVATLALVAFSSGLLNPRLPEAALEISVALGHSFHFGQTGFGEISVARNSRGQARWWSVSDIHPYLH